VYNNSMGKELQKMYQCPNCGFPLVELIRYCGNCGAALTWYPSTGSTQLALPQPAKRADITGFIGILGIIVLTGILIAGGIILYDSTRTDNISAAPVSQPLPLAAPSPSSPGIYTDSGQVIETLMPAFQWNAGTGAESYSLIISRFPYGAGNIVYSPGPIAATSLTLPAGILDYGEHYRWSVQALSSSSTSSLSESLYFVTPKPPASNPVYAAPNSGAVTQYTLPLPPPPTAIPGRPAWTPI